MFCSFWDKLFLLIFWRFAAQNQGLAERSYVILEAWWGAGSNTLSYDYLITQKVGLD